MSKQLKLEELHKNITALQKENRRLEAENAGLKTANAGLKAENERLKREVDIYKGVATAIAKDAQKTTENLHF